MKKCISIAAFLLGGASQSALAANTIGFYVEPGVTYEVANGAIEYPSPFSHSSGKLQGYGAVARVGLHLSELVFLGVDGRYSRPRFTDSTNNLDSQAEAYNYGPFVGVQMPIVGLRLWAGYILGGVTNPVESNNVDFKFSGANGFRLGAGLRILMVSLNLEYEEIKHATTTLEKLGPFTTNTDLGNTKYNTTGYVVSVTFPLEL